MTVSVVHIDTDSTSQGWHSLRWLAPLTVLWIVLIYWQPIIPTSGVPTTAHQLTVHGFIALGLWLGLESTDTTPDQRRTRVTFGNELHASRPDHTSAVPQHDQALLHSIEP